MADNQYTSQKSKNDLDDLLAEFTDRLLSTANTETQDVSAADEDAELRELKKIIVRLKHTLAPCPPTPATVRNIEAKLIRTWNTYFPTGHRESLLARAVSLFYDTGRRKLAYALALGTITIAAVLIIAILPLKSAPESLTGATGYGSGWSMVAVVVLASIISGIALWLSRGKK